MGRGFAGTYALSWKQTEIDGQSGLGPEALRVGVPWLWRGEALRLDGPSELLQLARPGEAQELHRSAARMLRRMALSRPVAARPEPGEEDSPLLETGFVLTDGRHGYTATLVPQDGGRAPLLMFRDSLPEAGREHWVVRTALEPRRRLRPAPGGLGSGLVAGTRIATPSGPRLVEDLCIGDLVQTRDAGPQRLLGIEANRISGARLHMMPHLRPVHIHTGAFGLLRPEESLLVSPDHRMLIGAPAARALFNTDEVLVLARDLINGRSIVQDLAVTEVLYVQLRLRGHHVLIANGLPCESLLPAEALRPGLRPGLGDVPPARRLLSQPEAAILMRDAA